jgi:hypothetical protein
MKEPVLRQLRFGALGDPQDVLTRRREMGQSTPLSCLRRAGEDQLLIDKANAD